MTVTQTIPWYAKHENLVTLTAWLAEDAYTTAKAVADAVEKPWKYEDEFRVAWAVTKHERETQHVVYRADGYYYCNEGSCAFDYEQDEQHVKSCASLQHGYSDIAGSYDVGDLPCDCGTDAAVAS